MSSTISGTGTILLTRGDTFRAQIEIKDADGNAYAPQSGDVIRFAMKRRYTDSKPLILKEIPTDSDSLILELKPEETKPLSFGRYVYDIQLTKANGDVDTFITKGIFELTEEVE